MFWLLLHLRVAYSVEIGAALAYQGHAAVTQDPEIAARIRGIEKDERHHRATVGALLERFDARPFTALELLYRLVGHTVAFGCRYWGDWLSALGAANLELIGIGDFGRAARAADRIGMPELAEQLRSFRRQEIRHRAFLLALTRSVTPWGSRPPLALEEFPDIPTA